MKQLINFTDHEKIEAFDRIYKDAYEAFQELTCNDFDKQAFIEGMVGDILKLDDNDWQKSLDNNEYF
jgi:hypothetical protein